jgi:hypothetical protein
MTENQTTEIDIAHLTNVTHEQNYNLRSERAMSYEIQTLVAIDDNHYATSKMKIIYQNKTQRTQETD